MENTASTGTANAARQRLPTPERLIVSAQAHCGGSLTRVVGDAGGGGQGHIEMGRRAGMASGARGSGRERRREGDDRRGTERGEQGRREERGGEEVKRGAAREGRDREGEGRGGEGMGRGGGI